MKVAPTAAVDVEVSVPIDDLTLLLWAVTPVEWICGAGGGGIQARLLCPSSDWCLYVLRHGPPSGDGRLCVGLRLIRLAHTA